LPARIQLLKGEEIRKNMSNRSLKFPRRIAAAVGGIVLAAILMTSNVLAVSRVTGPNDTPANAQALDLQTHALAAGQAQWYRLNLAGQSGEYAVLRLPGASKSGLQFEIYSTSQLNDWMKQDPLGVGNVEENGDLAWASQIDMNLNNDLFVRVLNNNTQCTTFQFSLTGATLSSAQNNGGQNGTQGNTNSQTNSQGNSNSQGNANSQSNNNQNGTQGNTNQGNTQSSTVQNNTQRNCGQGTASQNNTQGNGTQNGTQGNTNQSNTQGNTNQGNNTQGNTTGGTTNGNTSSNTNSNTTGSTNGGTNGGNTSGSITGGISSEPSGAMLLDTNMHSLSGGQSQWYCFSLPDSRGQFSTLSLPGMAKSGLRFEIYPATQINSWRDQDPIGRSNADDKGDLVWAVQSDVRSSFYLRIINGNAAMNNNGNNGANNGANSTTNSNTTTNNSSANSNTNNSNSNNSANNSANNSNSNSSTSNSTNGGNSACSANANNPTTISTADNNGANNGMNGGNNSTTGNNSSNSTANTNNNSNNSSANSTSNGNNTNGTNNNDPTLINYQFVLSGPFTAP